MTDKEWEEIMDDPKASMSCPNTENLSQDIKNKLVENFAGGIDGFFQIIEPRNDYKYEKLSGSVVWVDRDIYASGTCTWVFRSGRRISAAWYVGYQGSSDSVEIALGGVYSFKFESVSTIDAPVRLVRNVANRQFSVFARDNAYHANGVSYIGRGGYLSYSNP